MSLSLDGCREAPSRLLFINHPLLLLNINTPYQMKTITLLISALTVVTAQVSFSQVLEPGTILGYVEGPVNRTTFNADGTGSMVVMNVNVDVPADLIAESPTNALSVRHLCIRNRLPGRLEPGFVGGTALINGIVETATGKFTATEITVEPAENVVIGTVTSISPLRIQNTEVAFISDPRITTGIINAYGFPALLTNLALGQAIAAEGYFASGKLQGYVVQLDETAALAEDVTQINIMRAASRERTPNNNRGDEVDMRGFYYSQNGAAPQIQVFRDDNGVLTSLGLATSTPDGINPKFGTWNYRADTPTTNDPLLGTAPTKLKVVITVPGAGTNSAEIEPDLR
jgi:hypothetical protein